MGRLGIGGLAGFALLLWSLPACNTTDTPEPSTDFMLAPVTAFVPAAAVSPVHVGESRYPTLFSPDSYAVWVTPEVAAAKRHEEMAAGGTITPALESTASAVDEHFYVFECHVASAFPQASIGYDVVGLRNIEVYLLSPDGNKVRPAQSILGSHADETQVPNSAIKHFKRTNILVFPKRDIILNQPTIVPGAEGVRLVFEGFNSVFYFEWVAAPDSPSADPTFADKAAAAYASTKLTFTEIFASLREAAHMFD